MQPVSEGRGRSVRVLGALVVLLVLLAVVAFSSRSGFGSTSAPTARRGYVDWAMSVFLVLFVLMIPFAAYAYSVQMREFRAQNRRSMQARTLRSMGVILVVVGLLALREYVRHHSGLLGIHSLFGGTSGLGRGASRRARTTPYNPTFQWPVLYGTIALLAAAATVAVWRLSRRTALPADAGPSTLSDDVADTIGDAIDDLVAEPDPRRAVIAAYARMEHAFGRHGLHRSPSETPTEYLRRLLLGLTTRVEAVRRLTTLFEQARFSDHEIDSAMKEDAIDSLRTIRDDLQAAPS